MVCGNCEGMRCVTKQGELRLLPYSSGNCILCRSCYEHEMRYRRRINTHRAKQRKLGNLHTPDTDLNTPTWEDLTIYAGG